MRKRSLVIVSIVCLSLMSVEAQSEPYIIQSNPTTFKDSYSTEHEKTVKEYVFTRPKKNKTEHPLSGRKSFVLYRVKVKGDSYQLLMRVKKFATGAFINYKERFVQAGLFRNIDQAHQVKRKLAKARIRAEIIINKY